MHYDDCSTDARPACAATAAPAARRPLFEMLRALPTILTRDDAPRVAWHVLLSLGAALAGSIAAIVLVPLIQPGHAPMFGGRALALPASRGTLVLMLALSVGGYALMRWWVAGLGARIVGGCAVRLRARAHAQLVDADLDALAGSTSAEIAHALTSNIDLVTQGVGATLQLLVVGVTTAVSLLFAFWVSPVLTLVLPALAALVAIASRWHGREQSRINRRYVADTTRLFWLSEDFPGRLRHIRSFQREDAEKAAYRAVAGSLGHGYRRQIELAASGKLLMELLAALGMAGVFLLAGRWQGVDQASLIAVGLLLGRLLPYLASTRYNFQQLSLAVPALDLWRRLATLASVDPATTPVVADPPARRLHIRHLRLQLPSLRLEVENLTLARGEMTLVAGDSGTGKSSLVDVLAGMTAPAAFTAEVDGCGVDFDAYRCHVRNGAYVSQNVRPWQRTVRECLLWAAPGSDEKRLREVLAQVGFAERLRDPHGGLDLDLHGPSSRLSGGELQRLLAAQVILKQPFLAVLDEATGALDAESELQVLAALKRHLPHTILVVVTHRQRPAGIAEQCLRIGADGTATLVGGTRVADAGLPVARLATGA